MIIYIVSIYIFDTESEIIQGVFSTREKAENYKKIHSGDILEWIVDEKEIVKKA